jgi:hypothetical protein
MRDQRRPGAESPSDLRLGRRREALDSTCSGRPVRDLEGEHAILRALMERPWSRSERVPAAGWTAFYLHRDQWCLLLWYEEERGILWLCHAGEHPEGEHSSVPEILSDRDAVDRYLPNEDDFLQLGPEESDSWHRQLVEVGSRRIDEARARPGQEVILDLVELQLAIRVDHEMAGHENLERVRLTFRHTEESARMMEVRWIVDRISVTLAHLFPETERSEFQHVPNPSTAADTIMTFVWKPSRKPEQDQPEPTGTT